MRARAAGLGAALAALGGELVEGAEVVLDTIGFDDRARNADLVVTGEGMVDATTLEGKAPGAVVRRSERLGVRCELFGGVVTGGLRAHALSGRRVAGRRRPRSAGRGASSRPRRPRASSSIFPRTLSSFAAQIA